MSASGHKLDIVGRKSSRVSAAESLSQKINEWKTEYAARNLIVVGGKPDGNAIIMASNDYLALGKDARIVQALSESLRNADKDIFMSTVYIQYLAVQQEYEAAMARYLGTEATVLCQSGWAANDGLLQALVDDETTVYIDHFAHASLWQGIHSGGAKPRPFRHNDPESLEAVVRRYGPGLIAVDTVYVTTGEICPLGDLVDIAEAYGCVVVADESHAVGLRGPQGAGLAAQLGLAHRVHFRTFSLSKAFVGRGGVVAGPARELEYFRFQSRPTIFSSAVLPYEIAGFSAALDAVRHDEWRREALQRNGAYLKSGLRGVGIEIIDHDSPIIALVGGREELTVKVRDALEAHGVFGAVFCAPSTPKNRSLVRLTLNAAMQQAELDQIVAACVAVRRETGII
jgi:CAI-1 autoinducer synthase